MAERPSVNALVAKMASAKSLEDASGEDELGKTVPGKTTECAYCDLCRTISSSEIGLLLGKLTQSGQSQSLSRFPARGGMLQRELWPDATRLRLIQYVTRVVK